MNFELTSAYKPTGDQPEAIAQLTDGVIQGLPAQTLLGVTGSGKTFTIANVIANINKPTLILSHNKTLAAQLYSEFKGFFPNNAVEYYVSYYDYYQPEAYLPNSDTYIAAAGWATSATVAASAIAAALATIFSAAWSDRVGKRRAFVCWGYILWGITTAAFALFGNGQVGGDVGLAVTLFVVMDCVMSAIGSTANDSAFSAWVTDVTDVTNRGVVDIVLSIMPILALIVIFAGFDGMTVHGNWTGFFLVLGGLTSAAGVLGLCIFRDSLALRPVQGDTYLRDVLYAFRPANIRANKMIYICFLGMMFSGLAMQLWQPYMISLVEVTLGIENYILPIGIVVLASAVLSVLAGKVMDRFGKEKFYYPVAVLQVLGGLIAYSIKFVGHAMPLLCVGGTCIMAGNLAMAGLFTASSRDYTPAGRAGASQSVKMVIYIMLPMVLASIIDPLIIRAVALEPTAAILAKYPSYAGSYLYPYELFLAAAVSAVFILIPAYFVRRDADRIRREKLAALEK